MSRERELPPGFLSRPAGEVARRLALGELARARAAREALGRGDDAEALHDLRVALRRLRSLLRAFRAELGKAVGGGARRRLARLARVTNPSRDAEVGVALLDACRAAVQGAEARALAALRARLAARADELAAESSRAVLARFDALAERLTSRLGTWHLELSLTGDGPAAPPSFRTTVASQIALHRDALADALAAARAGSDPGAAHRSRIEAKRLRYLLDPLSAALPAARSPLDALERLQELLGALNDLRVLGGELAAEGAAAERWRLARTSGAPSYGPRPPGGRAGRNALARRLAGAARELERRFEREWLAASAASSVVLDRGLAAVVAELS